MKNIDYLKSELKSNFPDKEIISVSENSHLYDNTEKYVISEINPKLNEFRIFIYLKSIEDFYSFLDFIYRTINKKDFWYYHELSKDKDTYISFIDIKNNFRINQINNESSIKDIAVKIHDLFLNIALTIKLKFNLEILIGKKELYLDRSNFISCNYVSSLSDKGTIFLDIVSEDKNNLKELKDYLKKIVKQNLKYELTIESTRSNSKEQKIIIYIK